MSITIGRIENKFWSNSGHKFPNGFPVYAQQEELKLETPNMNDFMSGTIYLHGENWNHCKYDGAYYSLYIIHLVSHRKKKYLYRLERDLWMDILLNRPKVIGDLANTNNDTLLEANLNRTISVLDNPARVITINFNEIDFDWSKEFTFKESKKDLTQIVLSKDNFNIFVEAAKTEFAKNWKEINKAFYSFDFGYPSNLRNETNDCTFILSYIPPSKTKYGWKHVLREKINEFVRSIDSEERKNLKISKVNAEAFRTSRINGNYCITHKVDGISTTEENVRLSEIDLSELTDIIPINIHDLREVEPSTPLGEGKNSGLFDVIEETNTSRTFFAKIRRKSYLPIGATADKTPKSIYTSFQDPKFNWRKANEPQSVSWAYEGRSGTFNLWFLDNVNFMALFDNTVQEVYATNPDAAEIIGDVFAGLGSVGIFNIIKSGIYFDIWKYNWAFRENSFFKFPFPVIYARSPFPKLVKESVVPFGLLIYGLQRRYREWRKYEYIADDERNKVFYYAGLKSKFLEKYSDRDKWWSRLNPRLSNIQPTEELTKFYLDNYYFSWLCFFPSSGILELENNGWGTFAHTASDPNIRSVMQRDLHDIDGKWKKVNPFTDARFPNYRNEVDSNLWSLFNHKEIELPKGLSISKGDYFFSDQDYEIVEYPSSNFYKRFHDMLDVDGKRGLQRSDGFFYAASGFFRGSLPNAFLAEDMMEIRGSKPFADKPGENFVVLCATKNGGIEIRSLSTFERELTLNSSGDEILEAVEGSTKRLTRFTLLKKISEELGTVKYKPFKGFEKEDLERIIYTFYKVHGYKVKIVEKIAHWTWFSEIDFEEGSDVQQLFDLVGTDWYAFVAKGKISLISKKTSLFKDQGGKTSKLAHSENGDLNLSLVEKINQKVRFQFFNAPYYLNWKTSFTDKDKISLNIETLRPTELQTQFEQYFIRLDTEFDSVYYENISVPKKQTKALSPADTVQLERLNLDLASAQYSHQIEADKHKLATERFYESIRRAETDLYHQRLRSFLQLGGGAAASAFGAGISFKYRQGRNVVTTLKKTTKMIDDPNNTELIPVVNKKGKTRMKRAQIEVPIETKQIKHTPGKVPNIVAGIVAAGLTKVAGTIMDHAFTFPEQERRIGVDKQLGAADLALESLVINTAFMEDQINHQAALNRITNMHSNPIINDREIMETFMEKDKWHGKKLKPAHLICFVPSDEQLVALRSFKEEYGVMCDIPDIEMSFYDGMEPDIVRYRNLDDDAIKGLPNEWMRVFLHAHLLTGIKIVKTTSYTYTLMTSDEYQDKIFRLNTDLIKKINEADAKDKEIITLTGQIDLITNEKQECSQQASQLQKRITEIENQTNIVNQQLRDKIAELEKAKEKLEDEKKKALQEHGNRVEDFEKRIKQVQQEIDGLKAQIKAKEQELASVKDQAKTYKENAEELEQKLNNALREHLNEKDRINELNKQLQEKVTELEKTKAECEKGDGEKQKKIDELQTKINNIQQKIDEANEKLRDKEVEVGKWKDIAQGYKESTEELTQQLNNERRKYLDERDEINRLNKKLEEEKKAAEESKEEANKELQEKKEELAQLRESYAAKTRELDTCKLEKAQQPSEPPKKDPCVLIKELLGPSDFPQEVTRENGFNQFLDLIFALAEKLSESRGIFNLADVWEDNPFSSPEMVVVKDSVDQVFDLPLIKQALEITRMPGWKKYLTWLEVGGDKNGDVDAIIKEINEIKEGDKPVIRHGLKALMDKANYSSYLALKNLNEKVGEDIRLQAYFANVYPSNLMDKYEAAFGDSNVYIMQQRYKDEVQCVVGGKGNSFDVLTGLKETTKIKDKIPAKPEIPPGPPGFEDHVGPGPRPGHEGGHDVPPTITIDEEEEGQPDFNGDTLVELNEEEWFRYPAITYFEDAYSGRRIEEPNYQRTCNGRKIRIKDLAIENGVQFWKWHYSRRVSGKDKKMIWAIARNNNSSIRSDKRYVVIDEPFYRVAIKYTKWLWENRSRIKIPSDFLEAWSGGEFTLLLHSRNDWIGTSLTHRISLGKGRRGEKKLNLPRKYREDFLRFLFIFYYFNREIIKKSKRDDYDNYDVFEFFEDKNTMDYWALNNFNASTKRFPSYETMLIGFNEEIDRFIQSFKPFKGKLISFHFSFLNSSDLKDGIKRSREENFVLKTLRYFWRLMTYQDFVHPWEMGCEGFKRMADKMETIANSVIGTSSREKMLGLIEGE